MRQFLLLVGSILPLIAVGVYVKSIFKGTTKPHRMTYFLLSIICGLAFASLLAADDTSGVWLAGISFIEVFILFILSLKWGMGGKDPFDVACLALCAMGIAAWLLLGDPLVGLIAAVVADFLAVLPSVRKMWLHPHTEIWSSYCMGAVAGLLVAMVGPYGWRTLLYPLYLFVINGLCVVIIVMRGRQTAIAPEGEPA